MKLFSWKRIVCAEFATRAAIRARMWFFYTISDGGHTWPGGKPLPKFITGKTTQEINATRLMWEFFVEQTGKR